MTAAREFNSVCHAAKESIDKMWTLAYDMRQEMHEKRRRSHQLLLRVIENTRKSLDYATAQRDNAMFELDVAVKERRLAEEAAHARSQLDAGMSFAFGIMADSIREELGHHQAEWPRKIRALKCDTDQARRERDTAEAEARKWRDECARLKAQDRPKVWRPTPTELNEAASLMHRVGLGGDMAPIIEKIWGAP